MFIAFIFCNELLGSQTSEFVSFKIVYDSCNLDAVSITALWITNNPLTSRVDEYIPLHRDYLIVNSIYTKKSE